MKRLFILSILCLAGPVSGFARQAAPEQGAPPSELELRDGFWTANRAAPDNTENFQIHTVLAGDTLWAVAATYMNDPFLWPQLWESNAHVVNPHWIYPGDVILIRPVTQITEVVPPPPPPPQIPEAEPDVPRTIQYPTLSRPDDYLSPPDQVVLNVPAPRPVSPVKPVDLYCSGFITTREIEGANSSVVAQVPPGEGLLSAEGRYLYINRGAGSGLAAGDMLTVVRPTRDIESPRDGVGDLGRHYLELGQIRAIMVQADFALARVEHSCAEIALEDVVVDFQEIDFPDLPSNRPFSPFMPSSGNVTGAIAVTLNPLRTAYSPALGGVKVIAGHRRAMREEGPLHGVVGGLAGDGNIVYVDLGRGDGIATGDIFVIYRKLDYRKGDQLLSLSSESARLLDGERYAVGELVILKVEERAATALVTFSSDGVSPGDFVELR